MYLLPIGLEGSLPATPSFFLLLLVLRISRIRAKLS
jgi:hypothetical protein